jgi:ABC-type Fe3+/spermidine/putrescine transport system ATPase subunit
VADFLGAAGNFIPARAESTDGPAVTVTALGASITFPRGEGGTVLNGQNALLVVRPEEIDLTDTDRGQLVGAIESVAYTGETTEYVVKLQDGKPLLVKGLGRPRHAEHEHVGVIVREAALLPLAEAA